ncbi:hypothetical protein ACFWVC_28125 [Streptomyces sp. NPDC058691]|uniref:hypothetical protein n=1 Tax=Streptomyces sp. NPDC058691 TaxID=3346601 RepID=UPI00364CFF3C
MTDQHRDTAVVVASNAQDQVAIPSVNFPRHGVSTSSYPEAGASPARPLWDAPYASCDEEAGITAQQWHHLGRYAITLASAARVYLYAAQGLTLGPQ